MKCLGGKIIYSESSLQNSIIMLNDLSAGMYFVEVINGDQRIASEKLMVE